VAERWAGKVALLAGGALVFFLLSLIVFLLPAPVYKIDVVLMRLNVRRILRRTRKRALMRIHDNDRNERTPAIDEAASTKFKAFLADNNIEAAVELRRAAFAARSAGLALETTVATAEGLGVRVGILGGHEAFVEVGDPASLLETYAESALESILDAPDIDGSLAVADTGVAGLRSSASGAVLSAARGARARLGSLLSQATSLVSPGQLKIVMGNLQINASLTVVFAIPWPPVHAQFLEFLNVFKLDFFKGLAFAVPCLHSSHFMSLATFIATPLVLVAVFALAFGSAALVIFLTRRSSRACKHRAKTFLFGKATMASAGSAAVKMTLVVILFIYPTICSKVFTTFKCVDVGGGEYFLVRSHSPALQVVGALLCVRFLDPTHHCAPPLPGLALLHATTEC
jgi:hypothetical protein